MNNTLPHTTNNPCGTFAYRADINFFKTLILRENSNILLNILNLECPTSKVMYTYIN
jgi:hypothetical protein